MKKEKIVLFDYICDGCGKKIEMPDMAKMTGSKEFIQLTGEGSFQLDTMNFNSEGNAVEKSGESMRFNPDWDYHDTKHFHNFSCLSMFFANEIKRS